MDSCLIKRQRKRQPPTRMLSASNLLILSPGARGGISDETADPEAPLRLRARRRPRHPVRAQPQRGAHGRDEPPPDPERGLGRTPRALRAQSRRVRGPQVQLSARGPSSTAGAAAAAAVPLAVQVQGLVRVAPPARDVLPGRAGSRARRRRPRRATAALCGATLAPRRRRRRGAGGKKSRARRSTRPLPQPGARRGRAGTGSPGRQQAARRARSSEVSRAERRGEGELREGRWRELDGGADIVAF